MKANEFLTKDNVTLVLPLSNVVCVHYGDKQMFVRCVKDEFSGHTFLLVDGERLFVWTFQELKSVLDADSMRVEDSGIGCEFLEPQNLSNVFVSTSYEQEKEIWDTQNFYKFTSALL